VEVEVGVEVGVEVEVEVEEGRTCTRGRRMRSVISCGARCRIQQSFGSRTGDAEVGSCAVRSSAARETILEMCVNNGCDGMVWCRGPRGRGGWLGGTQEGVVPVLVLNRLFGSHVTSQTPSPFSRRGGEPSRLCGWTCVTCHMIFFCIDIQTN
jgi:hypothetical protein